MSREPGEINDKDEKNPRMGETPSRDREDTHRVLGIGIVRRRLGHRRSQTPTQGTPTQRKGNKTQSKACRKAGEKETTSISRKERRK